MQEFAIRIFHLPCHSNLHDKLPHMNLQQYKLTFMALTSHSQETNSAQKWTDN
jgi:hypothetical protein